MFSNKNVVKSSTNFCCEKCDYITVKKYNYDKHLLTAKHKKSMFSNDFVAKSSNFSMYTCETCNKGYKDYSGLWRHKKRCFDQTNKECNDLVINDKDTIILQLLKQNSELQQSLVAMSKEKTITNNISTNNSNNKTFNLQVFLNETCKDALNIQDFVSSIQFNLEDLENTGRKGYIEGISNIILKNLNKLEQYLRPIHCSDYKREVLYIKDNNKWEKECETKPILTNAIKTIANGNIKQIKEWRDKNPDCTDSDSKKNNLYLKIVSNSMNGITEEESQKNLSKIISNVAKEVVIDKL
jgi:hypothetical protein